MRSSKHARTPGCLRSSQTKSKSRSPVGNEPFNEDHALLRKMTYFKATKRSQGGAKQNGSQDLTPGYEAKQTVATHAQ